MLKTRQRYTRYTLENSLSERLNMILGAFNFNFMALHHVQQGSVASLSFQI